MSKKQGVKKGSAQAQSFVAQKETEKTIWTMKVLAYAQQEMLDAMALTLAEFYGFGPERNKRFHDRFEEKYAEIRRLENEDTEDREYCEEVVELALQKAYGQYYEPRDVRYNIHLTDKEGNVWKL